MKPGSLHSGRCICGNQTWVEESVDRTTWRSSNPLELYSQGPPFEYQVGHRLFWLFVILLISSPSVLR
jgi:hypothetical protein